MQDDLNQHKLTGRHALSAEGRRFVERCIIFLASNVDYVAPPGRLGRVFAAVRGLNLPPGTPRNSPWWPFGSQDAYRGAVETLGRAQAVERGVEAEYDRALAELAGATDGRPPD